MTRVEDPSSQMRGTLNPELYQAWRPRSRLFALLSVAGAGGALWWHAASFPDAIWYVAGEESYAGLYETVGVMFIALAAIGAIPLLLMPWQARRATMSPLEVTISKNELRVSGGGRYAAILKTWHPEPQNQFSNDADLVADPGKLAWELESCLYSLDLRLKPFVVVRIDTTEHSRVTPAELCVIEMIFSDCRNVLDYCVAEEKHETSEL